MRNVRGRAKLGMATLSLKLSKQGKMTLRLFLYY